MKNAIQSIALLLTFVLFQACGHEEQTLWVNSYKVQCSGQDNEHCLQIYEGDSLVRSRWSNYECSIEGFKYQAGYLYKLIVQPTLIDVEMQKDAQCEVKYVLRDVLEMKPDPLLRLTDLWVAISIDGEVLEKPKFQELPTLEINLPEKRVFGIDGCNNYHGLVQQLDTQTIEFGPIATTRKMCFEMDIPDRYEASLSTIKSYAVENDKLFFFDEAGETRIIYRHID